MESPNKRLKQSPREEDFIALGGDDEEDNNTNQYGYNESNGIPDADQTISQAPRAPRAMHQQQQTRHFNARNDPRHAKDRPKSKHLLPNHEPWILIKTRFGRRFVHNTATRESFWRVPQDVMPAVLEFERWEAQQREKSANAKWAEEQLEEMRGKSQAGDVNRAADAEEGRGRRRRSESLQREDEEAMMAELAAEAERKEEGDVKEVVEKVEGMQTGDGQQKQAGGGGYDSDSSYEEVEVTDSEFEDDDEQARPAPQEDGQEQHHDDGPVEFGEDDIAFQLAAMEQDNDMDGGEFDDNQDDAEDWDEEAEDDALSPEDATNLFRDMLTDHQISPFTPWENLIADESPTGILMDDRYTVLPNMRTRKEVWEQWVKDSAARLKEERARMEKQDPRIPYLAFLAEKASPKLYWPEFKRKFKKEGVMNERKLGDKEREKLYRDHINRLKLPESTRKADLIALMKTVPLRALNKNTSLDALPQQLLGHLHFISLPFSTREQVLRQHISSLPPAPEDEGEEGELTEEQRAEEEKARDERRRREKALAERERKVGEEKRKAEKEGRWARRELLEEEREVRKAMEVGREGLKAHLRE